MGGSVSITGLKDVVVGRQMASDLLLHEIKQKYMLKTSDASQLPNFAEHSFPHHNLCKREGVLREKGGRKTKSKKLILNIFLLTNFNAIA